MIRDLLDRSEGLLIQGATGRQARMEVEWMQASGEKVAAGVTPGRRGEFMGSVPIYGSVREALIQHDCTVSMNYAPPAYACDAAIEAFEAGIRLVVMSAEHVPLHRLAMALQSARNSGGILIGPNSQGIVVTGVGRVGCPGGMDPWDRFAPGPVAVVSRSGGMTSEIAMLIRAWGWGTSVHLALGGGPMVGTRLAEGVRLVEQDPATQVTVVFGEPAGLQELELAEAIGAAEVKFPVIALIGGRAADTMPAHIPFGHAPRVGNSGTVAFVSQKLEALRRAGAVVVNDTRQLRAELANLLVPRLETSKTARPSSSQSPSTSATDCQ